MYLLLNLKDKKISICLYVLQIIFPISCDCQDSVFTTGDMNICSHMVAVVLKGVEHLKNKNKDLKNQLEKEKKEVETTSLSITSMQNELSNLISKIEAKEKEIKYTEFQITTLEADIENKNQYISH